MLACIEGPSIGLVARFLNSNLEAVKVILNPTYATSLLYLYGSAPVNKKMQRLLSVVLVKRVALALRWGTLRVRSNYCT